MQKRTYFHHFGLFLHLGVPPILISKFVCRQLKKVENHCPKLYLNVPWNPIEDNYLIYSLLCIKDLWTIVTSLLCVQTALFIYDSDIWLWNLVEPNPLHML